MTVLLAWLAAIGPAALLLVGLIPTPRANADPRGIARRARLAALVALGASVATGLAVILAGPLYTGTLGIAGVGLALYADAFSAVMLVLVSFVGAIVVIYSRNYLDGDPDQGRFFKRLCVTIAAALLMMGAGNLFQLALAWIATSLALHQLLVFYRDRPQAVLAARKKALTSRAGDAALILAGIIVLATFGTLEIPVLLADATAMAQADAVPAIMHLAVLLIVVAALVKSAQFPAHGWLGEVMETPTPVSALLHAGIINGGGFLVVRLSPLVVLSAPSMDVLALVGGFTALFGSLVMLTVPSVKVALAYSTIGQMGFMLLQCGLGAFSAAALHIVAHALYKAHAFLSSGSAVETIRAALPPEEAKMPNPAVYGATLAAAVALTVAVGAIFGTSVLDNPGTFALAAVVALGVAHYLASVLSGENAARAMGSGVALAGLVVVAYYGLQAGAAWLLAGAVAPSLALESAFDGLVVGLVVVSFAAALAIQSFAPALAKHRPFAALYVHIANGFYVNAFATRLAARLAPVTAKKSYSEAPVMTKTNLAELDTDRAALARAETAAGPEAAETEVSLVSLEADVATACGRIAPLWPLKHFVAVNPYLGLIEQSFAEAASTLARISGARLTLPRSHYAAKHAAGEITDADLVQALHGTGPGAPADVAALKTAMMRDSAPRPLATTAAEAIDVATGRDPAVGAAALVVEEISKTCARVFDEGQALWRAPFRGRGLYAAWRAQAGFDRTPEVMGFPGFRKALAALPEDADGAIAAAIAGLGVPEAARADYLHRALATINGWASYARYLVWDAELAGGTDPVLKELLAVRLSYDAALLAVTPQARGTWEEALARMSTPRVLDPERVVDAILQDAAEIAHRRDLVSRMVEANRTGAGTPAAPGQRPAVQAAFCIDVRSEVFRRALETVAPDVQTIGFAGFFGLPIEYVPFGRHRGGAQCPVLLSPSFVVCEEIKDADAGERAEIAGRRRLRQEAAKAWKSFKQSAVSSFAYVEAAGLLFAGKLVGDTLGRTRPVPHPAVDGLDANAAARLTPSLAPGEVGGRLAGITVEQRVATAQVVLKAMSLNGPYGRLVMLAGHGSTTVNNPHASGLDCGACGGHTGEANARVTTAILNDPAVRAGLKQAGAGLPDDTWFVPALHDTTTDEVHLHDLELIPGSHAEDIAQLRARLAQAGALTRLERSALLDLDAPETSVDSQVLARSRDWSQVRPEWGLAGCAAFVAAPRARTRGVDLGGRAFLHDYEWQADEGFGILELIMTAPMVVASWISLQYYGSSVDNRAFGAGNKVLHNVVGGLGVLEGNGGDLKVGLPLQSVHDGARLVHEPLRLAVFIEAPIEEMNAIIARHDSVRHLVDNGWLHLFQLDDAGTTVRRYLGARAWETLEG